MSDAVGLLVLTPHPAVDSFQVSVLVYCIVFVKFGDQSEPYVSSSQTDLFLSAVVFRD